MKSLFTPESIDEQAIMLAHHVPIGRVWSSAFDRNSNLGKLIRGLGIEFYRLQLQTQTISTEMDINKTTELIEECEKSVGIPDDCFSTNVSIEDRRIQVRQKFSNFGGVQKAEDFVRVADIFGFEVRVTPTGGQLGTFPLVFPILIFDSARSATHTMFVEILNYSGSDIEFPLEFPIEFSSGGTRFLKCIFEVLASANVQVVFVPEGFV